MAVAARDSETGFDRATAEPFVQVAEVWVPDGEGGLRHAAGAYGPHTDFARRSVQMRFASGQGLVGAAAAAGTPVLWSTLDQAFARHDVAAAIGLSAGLAIPYFQGAQLTAVVVLLCGPSDQSGGAIELWEPSGVEDGLRLASAYYGGLDAILRPASAGRTLARGQGLPGRARWVKGPVLVGDLKEPSAFARADAARQAGLGVGLALPIVRSAKLQHVITLLSCDACPLARAFEVWAPDHRGHLRLAQSAYGPGLTEFAAQSKRCVFGPAEGLPGRAFSSGLPTVFGTVSVGPFVRHVAAENAGLEMGVALPIDSGSGTRSVVVLLR